MSRNQKSSQVLTDWYNCVPGGICQCVHDENLILLEISDVFTMIGYQEEELRLVCNNA